MLFELGDLKMINNLFLLLVTNYKSIYNHVIKSPNYIKSI